MTKIIIVFLLIGYLLGLETVLTNIIAQQLQYEKDIVSKEGLK